MIKRITRRVSLLLIIAVLLNSLPAAASQAAAPTQSGGITRIVAPDPVPPSPPLPSPTKLTATATAPILGPSLDMRVSTQLVPAAVGDTVPFTITVTNQGNAPAQDMVVTVPLPTSGAASS